jgi:nitrate reductase gamma subunit
VTPLDRATLPILIAGWVSGTIIEFDQDPTVAHNRVDETLFVWLPAMFTTHPHPEAMIGAPLAYQVRGLVVLAIIGTWPYTRLAGIVSVPVGNVLRRLARRERGSAASRPSTGTPAPPARSRR